MTMDSRTDPVAQWWRTSISDIEPNSIRLRGYAVDELIGRIGYLDMLWLLVRGELPGRAETALLEAAMLGGVDHGPHAPSIAVSRMAATCGVEMNSIIAQGIGVLGDVHGGAITQSMELIKGFADDAVPTDNLAAFGKEVMERSQAYGGYAPGYGHRFHTHDPRSPRLLSIADRAVEEKVIDGRYIATARRIEDALEVVKGRRITMNIDAGAGAVYLELGFAPPLGRALLVLSRSLGIIAHAWEQMGQNERIKGPVPKGSKYQYDGPAPRDFPSRDAT